ncbi:penicillin-binding protein [Puteibacter caeruleilacunae]|nr:penicillin-binding protein [Puteibacter caeruleilacunae]
MPTRKTTTNKRIVAKKKPAGKPRAKSKSRSKKNSTFKQKLTRFLISATIVGFILTGFFVLTVFWEFWGPVPSKDELRKVKTATASEIISGDGKTLGRLYIKNRTNVPIDKISPFVIKALIPTEDVRFFEHQGVDQRSLLRVFFKTLLMGNRSSGGGSTLSQQLAKNIYPRKNYGPMTMPAAKFREAIIATRMEKIYTKEEILNLYLNTVPFGEDTYGIESGAQRFFSKHAIDLKIEEAAVLVGMLKAPTSYNPRLFPERSTQRRNVVLSQMAKYDLITEKKAKELMLLPIKLKYNRLTHSDGPAPYLREKIRLEIAEWLKTHPKADGTHYNLYTDGLKIYTTIDSRLQSYAETAMKSHMTSLQQTFNKHWASRDPWGKNTKPLDAAIKRSTRYRRLKAAGKSEAEIKKIFNTPVQTKIFTWYGEKEVKLSPRDSVRHYLKRLNTGVLSMNPKTGKILAWVGGTNHHFFKYDHVTSKRQVGSVFKPLVYLSALESGYSPYEYYKNERKVYREFNNWSPENAENHYTGYYSMEGALAESVNTVAVDMIFKAGVEQTVDLANNMGITSELPEYPSLALGTANISLLDMVKAYSVMANRGKKVAPYYLVKITDAKGKLIHDFTENNPRPEQVVDQQYADIINHMLRSVVNDGTGRSLRRIYKLDNDIAGKTGTTQNHADGWFIGYSPNLVTGVWVGGEDMSVHFRSITYGQGAYMALPIYGKYLGMINRNKAFRSIRYDHFPSLPYGVVAQLNIPHYRENQDLESKFKELFAKKDKKDRRVRKTEEKKESKIYNLIRSIFKRKKR